MTQEPTRTRRQIDRAGLSIINRIYAAFGRPDEIDEDRPWDGIAIEAITQELQKAFAFIDRVYPSSDDSRIKEDLFSAHRERIRAQKNPCLQDIAEISLFYIYRSILTDVEQVSMEEMGCALRWARELRRISSTHDIIRPEKQGYSGF
jgi:hypothetical protein